MNPIDGNNGIKPGRVGEDPRSPRNEATTGTPTAPPQPAAASSSAESDAVTLTRTATELLELRQQLDALPDVDMQRVEAIRQALSDGSYTIDTARIVDNLIQAERVLR